MSWGHEDFEFNPSNQPVGGKKHDAATCPDCGIPVIYCQRVSSSPSHCWRWDYESADQLREAIREIVDAAEALTRPGSQGQEHVNAARMTNAIQAGSKLIGHEGILPELNLG